MAKVTNREEYLKKVQKRHEVHTRKSTRIEVVPPAVVDKTKRKPGEVAPGAVYVRKVKRTED